MINFHKKLLSNGLRVIVHEDHSTPIGAFNIMYDVGARDEDPNKTGFAHLFEHLMFGGSVNIPDFDKPLQERGGVSNAFTNNDITNYYISIPAGNIETAFWLDSDRLFSLAFSDKSLEVQRQVVIEEFRQRYLNQPYGDVWMLLRPLIYKHHPYQWLTIGKKIEHIADATMEDVKNFFFKHYTPSNAILCVAGPFKPDYIFDLAEKWFGEIDARTPYFRNIMHEPLQQEKRFLEVERDVPQNALYKAWRMPARTDAGFYACDLLSDILSRGKSAWLYKKLVQEKKLFSEISAYITGELDGGVLVVSGRPAKGVSIEKADESVNEVIEEIKSTIVSEEEMVKNMNKWKIAKMFEDMNGLSKAMNLCYFELLGKADWINTEMDKYQAVSARELNETAKKIFTEGNSSTLYYRSTTN